MNYSCIPTINVTLNGICLILLLWGRWCIKHQRKSQHKKVMLGAVGTSIAFLIGYSLYHYHVGSVPYPYDDWSRKIYFAILIPHILAAMLIVPGIITLLYFAFRGQFSRHRNLALWIWPIWVFVSVSGIIIYLMLYHLKFLHQ